MRVVSHGVHTGLSHVRVHFFRLMESRRIGDHLPYLVHLADWRQSVTVTPALPGPALTVL
jgi:hypothetical protein